MPFPSTLSSFNRPNPTDRLNNPSHSALHNTVSSALGQVEAVIGVDGASSVVGTMMYDLRSPASNGGGHVQTANKGGTGQTTYNKGDILVAQSSSVLTKLSISSVEGYALVTDSSQATGVKWGVPNNVPTVTVYGGSIIGAGASGPSTGSTSLVAMWFKPSTLSYAVIEIIGGGGGGISANGNPSKAGGGGAGAYVRKTISASQLPLAASVLLGRGGASSIWGGTTFFGSIIAATGGQSNPLNTLAGAIGGRPSILGDINIWGGDGSSGEVSSADDATGGTGGAGYFGGGGSGNLNSGGNISRTAGAGGGGAADTSNNLRDGGRGGEGMVIISEY
jgi:hypothetical protein